jgi:hypothetical protein
MASMIPVSGSAYTYSYGVLGERVAWVVGWALILEYAIAASTVSVGWSGYMAGILHNLHSLVPFLPNIDIPAAWAAGPFDGGVLNVPALFISLLVTVLSVIGTRESATVNAFLVAIKILALVVFIALALPVMNMDSFHRVRTERLGRYRCRASGGLYLLRLRRIRRCLYSGGRDEEPEPQHSDRPDRFVGDLHRVLHPGCGWRDRIGRRSAHSRAQRRGSRARQSGVGGCLQDGIAVGVQARSRLPTFCARWDMPMSAI